MTPADSARALLALLAGTDVVEPQMMEPAEVLRERLAEGDDSARAATVSMLQGRTLPSRVAAAVAEDTVDVVVTDGSSLPRHDAERFLAMKEERAVYPPLRTPLLRACRAASDPRRQRMASDAACIELGLPTTSTTPTVASFMAALRTFLTDSASLVPAAIELLSSTAKGPVHDVTTLDRALDRPDPAMYSDAVVVDAVRVTRASLPGGDALPLQRRKAPRLMAGHVVDDGAVIRILMAPSLRSHRHRCLQRGVGRAYARLLGVGVGDALGLMLATAPLTRVLGSTPAAADDQWRHTLVAGVVEARLAAAVVIGGADAVADPEAPPGDAFGIWHDQVRSTARVAVAFDPGADAIDALLAPAWPDGTADHTASDAAIMQAWRLASAAVDLVAIREATDEGVMMRRRALEGLREAFADRPAPTTAEAAGAAAAAAWRTLIHEVA